jgi:hypothetical protein
MRALLSLPLTLAFAVGALTAWAQEMPEMPPPQKEHAWLQQLVGEWTVESKMTMPGMEMTATGTETVRSLGGFWTIAEGKATVNDMTMESHMMLGYDVAGKRYVGTWAGSMSDYLWHYTGSVDKTGKVLTLDTEGPCPLKGGAMTKMREVITITDADHHTFVSEMQEDNGSWTRMMTSMYSRKK